MVSRRTISLPDELDAQLDEAKDEINVSAVCQRALSRELEHRRVLKKLGDNLERVTAHVEDGEGRSWTVAFQGVLLTGDDRNGVEVYLTGRRRLAFVAEQFGRVDDYDDLDAAAAAGIDEVLLAQVAEKLGVERVVELNI